jgi:hypothetical protein
MGRRMQVQLVLQTIVFGPAAAKADNPFMRMI